ncbi:MAG: amidohydrolase family protein [Pseudomonadota bacterium]
MTQIRQNPASADPSATLQATLPGLGACLLTIALGLLSGTACAGNRDLTAIANVSVLTMTRDAVLDKQTVLIEQGKITAIGPAGRLKIPANATVIDGSGQFLMPGLVDFHTHPRGDTELAAFRQYGVTRIVALGGELLGWHADARGLAAGSLPRIVSSTRPVDGYPPLGSNYYSLDQVADVAVALAGEQAGGAGVVKVYSNLSVPVLQEVALQAHGLGMPVIGHTPWNSAAADALDGQIDVVAHGEELFQYLGETAADADIAAVISRMKRHRVALVPNIVAYALMEQQAYGIADMLKDAQREQLSPTSYQEWLPRNNAYANRQDLDKFRGVLAAGMDKLKRITHAADQAGVTLLAGTDAPSFGYSGTSLLDELGLLSQSGLSNYQVLRTATANAAQVFSRFKKLPSHFGTLEPGQDADLILLAANPLQDLAALRQNRGVMIAGHWFSPPQLERDRLANRNQALAAQHIVDQYEDLLTHERIDDLIALLKPLPAGGFPKFSSSVVFRDVNRLAAAGKPELAIRLLSAAEAHIVVTPNYHNVLGGLKWKAGDKPGAQMEYRAVLAKMPGNAQALAGLAKLAAAAPDAK